MPIPEAPTDSYWDASPDFQKLCKRKLEPDAYEWLPSGEIAAGHGKLSMGFALSGA